MNTGFVETVSNYYIMVSRGCIHDGLGVPLHLQTCSWSSRQCWNASYFLLQVVARDNGAVLADNVLTQLALQIQEGN